MERFSVPATGVDVNRLGASIGSRAGAPTWWQDAVIYQVYPRSFADSDGDGMGDLRGVRGHLDHLEGLGVDALWLSPFYPSPQADAGYDVSDYRDVDPRFGTLADFDALVADAHARGLRIIVDLVPNHTSSEHRWFREALDAAPGSPERRRYVFRRGKGPAGALPPNNWRSDFGGSAWTRVEDGTAEPQWYLHLFDPGQPDLNWRSREVVNAFHDILRYWLRRGVDGFRVDVAHGLVKDESLRDISEQEREKGMGPMWDQPGVHEIYRGWHRVLDEFGPDRMLVGEAWVAGAGRRALYLRPDEMQQAFNFGYLVAGWDPKAVRTEIDESRTNNSAVGAITTWVLSNHDVMRHASRLGMADTRHVRTRVGPNDKQPDAVLGLARARALSLFTFALPGSVYVYQGEELGLPDDTMLPAEARQDPTFLRTAGAEIGRDGCRVPLPWEADAPALGFSPSGRSWLPQPETYRALAVDRQAGVPGSTLELYRAIIATRAAHRLGRGALEWNPSPAGVLDFTNGMVRVILNMSTEAAPLPDGTVLIASQDDAAAGGLLQPDRAVWLST